MNTREVFKKNLNRYIGLTGKTKREISEEIPIPYTTLVDWANGNKFPRADGIEKLANYFKILKSDLLEEKPIMVDEGELIYSEIKRNIGVKIPVLGSIPAGIPIEAIEDIIDYEEIPESWTRGGNEYFALKIKGESMMPEYRDKDTVIFKRQDTCDNNDDCAVMVSGNEATFKRVERLMEGIILKPLNPAFESKFYSNKEIEELPVRVIGVFWELRRGRAVK